MHRNLLFLFLFSIFYFLLFTWPLYILHSRFSNLLPLPTITIKTINPIIPCHPDLSGYTAICRFFSFSTLYFILYTFYLAVLHWTFCAGRFTLAVLHFTFYIPASTNPISSSVNPYNSYTNPSIALSVAAISRLTTSRSCATRADDNFLFNSIIRSTNFTIRS